MEPAIKINLLFGSIKVKSANKSKWFQFLNSPPAFY